LSGQSRTEADEVSVRRQQLKELAAFVLLLAPARGAVVRRLSPFCGIAEEEEAR